MKHKDHWHCDKCGKRINNNINVCDSYAGMDLCHDCNCDLADAHDEVTDAFSQDTHPPKED